MARKILLADDSVTAQNMGRRILGDAGYDVITVNNGSAALKKIAEFKPDVVILDVYMPGYGGLEVCVRIKDAPETASIPVLITVGKMEPFKAEEARRVRADAHMIKPFETNELLAAIAKLEDKIVPPRELLRGRSSKSASEKKSSTTKAVGTAAVDDNAITSESRSKNETSKNNGNKSKPAPDRRAESHKAETEDTQDTGFRDIGFRKIDRAEPERGASEEALSEQKDAEPKTFDVSTAAEPTPDDFPWAASVAEDVAQPATEVAVESISTLPATEETESAASSKDSDEPVVTFASAATQLETGEKSVFEINRADRENEVVAALASLIPTSSEDEKLPEASANFTGPRWIAESIPLSQEDSAVQLASEMEKAQAVSAAIEGERSRIAEEAAEESESVNAVNSTEPAVEAQPPVFSNPASSSDGPAEIETPAAQNFSESSEAISAIASIADDSSAFAVSKNHEDAFAAVASAGAAAHIPSESRTQNQGAGRIEDRDEHLSDEHLSDNRSEARGEDAASAQGMASAWENWKKIRDSIVGTNLTSNIVERSSAHEAQASAISPARSESEAPIVALSGFKDLRSEDHSAGSIETKADAAEAAEQASDDHSSEISSIVDTMLAELKPKLMEEIARKMGKDFKKD